MESLLSQTKLATELADFTASLSTLAGLKIKHPATPNPSPYPQKRPFIPAVRPSHRVLNQMLTLVYAQIPLCPVPTASAEAAAPDQPQSLTLHLKATKPHPLTFTLVCPLTSSISALKAALAASSADAPPTETQRWILKGKAMGDNKLLKEFDVQDGDIVNLMLKPSPAATTQPPAVTINTAPSVLAPVPMELDLPSSSSVPTLTLSSDPSSSVSSPLPPSSFTSLASSAPLGASPAFLRTLASPDLWDQVYQILKTRFVNAEGESGVDAGEEDAKKVWEMWFSASGEFIEPGEMARIRERTGVSRMGGV